VPALFARLREGRGGRQHCPAKKAVWTAAGTRTAWGAWDASEGVAQCQGPRGQHGRLRLAPWAADALPGCFSHVDPTNLDMVGVVGRPVGN